MSVANMHMSARQAGDLLKAVRFTREMQAKLQDVQPDNTLPPVNALDGLETMLLAALERIRDLEARKAAR